MTTNTTTTTRRKRKAPTRGKRGAGQVTQRGDTWAARWRENGAEKFKGGFLTETDARTFVDGQVARVKAAGPVDPVLAGVPTMGAYVATYLADCRGRADRGDLKLSTVSNYRQMLAHVTADKALSVMRIDEVTGATLGAFYNRLRANIAGKLPTGADRSGAGEGTVRLVHKALSVMFKHAAQWSAVPAGHPNPCRSIPDGTQARATSKARKAAAAGGDKVDPWRPRHVETLAALVADEPTAEKVACLLAAAVSLRVGEVCGLQWADVDLDGTGPESNGTPNLIVRRTRSIVDGNVVEGTPKTDRSARRVALFPAVRDALRLHKAAQADLLARCHLTGCENFGALCTAHGVRQDETTPVVAMVDKSVFRGNRQTGRPGAPCRPDVISRRTSETLTALGLPDVDGLHSLRHVFGYVFSNHAVFGLTLSPAVVSQMMGHTDPGFTLERYNRSGETLTLEAVSALYAVDTPA